MKFVTKGIKNGKSGEVYEAENLHELFKKYPSLRGKVEKVQDGIKLEVATPELIKKKDSEIAELVKKNDELSKEIAKLKPKKQ